MYSPLSTDKMKAPQQQSHWPPEPPTEATHGNNDNSASQASGSSGPHPNTHTPPVRSFTDSGYVSPTSIAMANMRFNETAPPVVSPTSSSPRPPGTVQTSRIPSGSVVVTPSPASSAALSRNNMMHNRSQQVPYSTMNDVGGAKHYNNNNNCSSSGAALQDISGVGMHRSLRDKRPQQRRSQTQSEATRERNHNKDSHRRRSSLTSSPHAQAARRTTRSRHADRRKSSRPSQRHQQKHERVPLDRIRRPLAAAPKFGHPFASNPDLPSLERASAAASSTSVAYTNRDHPGLNKTRTITLYKNKSFTSKEAAVPSSGVAAATNRSFGGGPLGDPCVDPDRFAQHHSIHHDSEIVVGAPGNGSKPSNNIDYSSESTKLLSGTIDLAFTPEKTFSQLQRHQQFEQQKQQQLQGLKVEVTSNTLDNGEGAPFQLREDRNVRVPDRDRKKACGGSSSNAVLSSYENSKHDGDGAAQRDASSGHVGDYTTYQPHHYYRNRSNYNESNKADQCERYSASAHSYSTELEESTTSRVTRDSFGYPIYHPIFRHGAFGEYDELYRGRPGGGGDGAQACNAAAAGGGGGGVPPAPTLEVPTTTDVPWDLRNTADKEINKTFAFLSTRYFWFLIEYALRVTCIAMMIPAIIINLNLKYMPFVSTTFALTSVVIAVGTNFGQSCVFFVQYVKGGCIWLPLATICSALKLNRYLGAWFVVYVMLLFLMATFTEKTTRRMCLLLYNISMVSLLSGDESLVFPTRVLADWALGAAFALVATLIPYPMLATRFSAHITKIMFKNTATCFTGILSCFWAPSNTERSMSMVRIRSLVRTLDHLIEKFDSYDAFTFYEVLIYETSERREVRKEKVKLLLKLKMNLRAMERVINMVQEKPQMIDLSERCLLLRDHLSVPMDDISRSMEALLWKLSEAKKYDQLRTLSGYFEATGRAMKRLQTEFDVGRRVLFYEHQEASMLHDGRMEEFVPLMTFFVFSIVNFWTTLEEFETFIDRHKATNDWKESFKLVWNALVDPFVENAELVRLLCVRRAEPEVRVVVEAAKVSVAMLISVIFFYYVDNQSLLLTGPSIIAFVSGTNPVEAVQAGAARMSGTMIGAVLGFFAASLCHTAVDRVAALCVITFVMTFFRPGQKFGAICMYCNFVAVSSLAPTEQTADITISRIQQNTFAIFIYCFISVAVFPVSPNNVLFKKRMSVLHSLNTTLQKMTSLFNDAARSYIETRVDVMRGAKTEDDVVSISHPDDVANNNFSGLSATRMSDSPPVSGGQHNSNKNGNNAIVKLKGLNNSDIALAVSRSNSNVIMPGAFTMAPQDTVMEKIFTDIFAMLDVMKATSSVMPLAADEFQIIPHEYPLRASGDVHAALYRLCALVYTMACAWKTMREKGYFTMDMLHILHNLAPIANDIARCIDRFTHVMEFYIRFPSSGLSSELTKGAMQFRALCVELSARKERDLIAVIRHTIMMKRIRNDDSVNEQESSDDGGEQGGNKNGDSNNGPDCHSDDSNGGTGHSPNQRSRRVRGHKPRHRRGSRLRSSNGNKKHKPREVSNGSNSRHRHQQQQRHRSSHSHLASSQNDMSESGQLRPHSCDNNRFNVSTNAISQVRSDAPFYNADVAQGIAAGTARAGEFSTTKSTLKDNVMPCVDSSDQMRSRTTTTPMTGYATWLPVPRSELPEMPSHWRQDQDMDQYQYTYPQSDNEGENVSNISSPRSRADGIGNVTNATRVFDPSVFPPPPLDDEQVAAVRRARLKAQLPPSMQGDSVSDHAEVLRQSAAAPIHLVDGAPPQLKGDGEDGDEQKRPQLWYPHATSDSLSHQHPTQASPRTHHHQQHSHLSHSSLHHRSSRHPQRLVAHEESPATKKPSALLRADRLRENIRGFGRQASTGAITHQHSSFEVRTFGASYTNIASMDKSATIASHNPAHHRPGYARHYSHHFSPHQRDNKNHSHSSLHYKEDEEETERVPDEDTLPHHGRSNRRAHTVGAGGGASLESSLPYGSREGDLTLLPASKPLIDMHESASVSSSDSQTADGSHKERAQKPQLEKVPFPSPSWQGGQSASNTHLSQDRITLDQSSSDGEEQRKAYSSNDNVERPVSSSYSSSSGSGSYESDESDRSNYGSSGSADSDSYWDDDEDRDTSPLVRFNDSFTTPIMVQDAEGLHAFTLSLEMFGKELRRVLYGFEEMLQSL